jgi:hypothetical protein
MVVKKINSKILKFLDIIFTEFENKKFGDLQEIHSS